MAGSFAVMEFLLLNGYSCSIMAGFGSVSGLSYNGNTTDLKSYAFDEHNGGTAVSLIVHSFMYTALSACLYELISQLKASDRGNLFNETVIHVGAEFSRSPTFSGKGSEHGWRAAVASVLSGVISAPMVIGNSLKGTAPPSSLTESNASGDYGTWGEAATVDFTGGKFTELTIGHMTSTICRLLRVNPLLPTDMALADPVAAGSGPLSNTVELAKIKG
jgi:hypothetical protein